jgi:acylphosphatase
MHFLHAVIHGRVQGVGFRAFVERRASEHGVYGEVRNTADGGVEVVAEGDPGRLDAFLADLREGPSHARVDHVESRDYEGASRFRRFSISG